MSAATSVATGGSRAAGDGAMDGNGNSNGSTSSNAATILPSVGPAPFKQQLKQAPSSSTSTSTSKSGNKRSSSSSSNGGHSNGSTSKTSMGHVDIDIAVVDALPASPEFPAPGFTLRPSDAEDPLLVMCGKAMAAVGNRALTPKEIGLICARKWDWRCRSVYACSLPCVCFAG